MGTHVPHAAGAAYALKLGQPPEQLDQVSFAYFGDGCGERSSDPQPTASRRCHPFARADAATRRGSPSVGAHPLIARLPSIASTGDVPSALQIAAVHGCPTIFFCRNNGYAISTNAKDQ